MGVISVDGDAVRGTAEAVDALSSAVEAAGGTLASSLLAAEISLAGSSSAGACTGLTDAAHDVHGDLATALDGLAQGLESVVATFQEVDEVGAEQATAMWSTT